MSDFFLGLFIAIALILVVVVITRLVGAWMFKIDDVIRLQKRTIELLGQIRDQKKGSKPPKERKRKMKARVDNSEYSTKESETNPKKKVDKFLANYGSEN